jgi:hypothetical protein
MVILAICGLSPINAAEIYSMIRRREFIAGLGGAMAWPLPARAQQSERVRRVGVPFIEAIRAGLADGP